jgi:hypothetical protein
MLTRINKNPSDKELRQFAWTLLIGFGLLGGILFWKGKRAEAHGVWILGFSMGLLSLVMRTVAKRLYRLWMTWAYGMGIITSHIVMTIVFFLVITPVALVFRLMGKDTLRLKKQSDSSTYWLDHPKITDRSYYQRLF